MKMFFQEEKKKTEINRFKLVRDHTGMKIKKKIVVFDRQSCSGHIVCSHIFHVFFLFRIYRVYYSFIGHVMLKCDDWVK